MLSDQTLDFAERLTAATLGVDRLYREEQVRLNPEWAALPAGSMRAESLVAVALRPGLPTADFPNYATARAQLAELAARAEGLPEPDRQIYYRQACGSVSAFAAWRVGELPFAQQLPSFLHVPAQPASEAELDGYRAKLHTLLTGLGYVGDLGVQAAAWEERNQVPADGVAEVMSELMAVGRDRARTLYPLPDGDAMRPVTERGVAYNARCDYLNRNVHVNVDPVLTRPGLKHLVAHECYPGHYVQFQLRERLWAEGRAGMDGLLSVINHASSSTFEGVADTGIWFMDWVESDDDRVALVMAAYRAAIGTGAAWRLHGEGWPPERVTGWLRAQTLVGGEGWVQNRMRFISLPHRTALIWSYWCGERAVGAAWQSVAPGRRRAFFDWVYGRLHSCDTVTMFT